MDSKRDILLMQISTLLQILGYGAIIFLISWTSWHYRHRPRPTRCQFPWLACLFLIFVIAPEVPVQLPWAAARELSPLFITVLICTIFVSLDYLAFRILTPFTDRIFARFFPKPQRDADKF
ncbi:hypothetical protein BH09VER1_BH09VER1_43370 [soil metagenome]